MADKYVNKARLTRQEHRAERCREKRSFSNEVVARQHNRGQRPYQCNVCGSWHLASYKVRMAIRAPVPLRYRNHRRSTSSRG